MKQTMSDSQNRTWLCPPDPSTNQNIACNAQHEGTATWFFEGSVSKEWKSKSKTRTSLLWIHGKRVFVMFLPVILDIDPFDNSRFREEHPLVCYHHLASPLWNLHRQLALQSSKTLWRCRRPGKLPWPISISTLGTPINKTSTTRFLPFLHNSLLVLTATAISSPTFIRHTKMAHTNPTPQRWLRALKRCLHYLANAQSTSSWMHSMNAPIPLEFRLPAGTSSIS
jgi:hypothetical protein